ncbi:aminotransferase class I/II-fold pyridoxal phosphate-dependent enzyme [Paenibacillus sp. 481]|uniref:aminotransferase class I/II-fold pyridoxal phosphate-dependent enzyme n=1 Tax=Paenibacillus sp. 481 TaxID=2835869 RepID=UPI001E596007|nr:aminotransferase class I/II-fold pyridoxal phosphate-dependent enzyme [Paenibacillus sp. 481]UHA74534.1 aminotransferase class I/II-fold pyridoxal phosphate-dependent enzyme [Paenibacillus sp. 481]
MNPLAQQLNETIRRDNQNVYDMLSRLGQQIYFPKEGILSQSAEAASKAKTFNATIGIATEGNGPMHLRVIQDALSAFNPKDIYPYAPPAGKPELRKVWLEKMLRENPSLVGKKISHPIVTNALTHGLSIVADLFAEEGDVVILPDKNWENYELTFNIRRGAEMVYYPLFDANNKFNVAGLREALHANSSKKAIVLLNFPNNPTGYTPDRADGEAIVAAIKEAAEAGMKLVVVTDDAYFGLFFEDSMHESLFGALASLHPNVLPVKVDGATKEEYVWGFRVGFITYAADSAELLAALEQKTLGIIRATISSGPHPSQTFVLHALQAPEFEAQKEEKFQIMKRRANKVKALLDSGKYGNDVWTYYPFNSGYFMCLKLNTVHAETLRTHLLDQYGVGTIALGETDLRVAFSCTEEQHLEQLFDTIYQGILELTS